MRPGFGWNVAERCGDEQKRKQPGQSMGDQTKSGICRICSGTVSFSPTPDQRCPDDQEYRGEANQADDRCEAERTNGRHRDV